MLLKKSNGSGMRHQSKHIDTLILACLLLFAIIFAMRFVDFSLKPVEDAAMLMRYAEHLAGGYGIVWNIGEAPVDGATDFLFMVILGLTVKAGLTLEFATRVLGFSAHLLTVGMVYLSLRRLFHAPILIAVLSAAYLIVGPGFFYVACYFGTTFFAFSACIAWYLALLICQSEENHPSSLWFALSALITALIRPEGVILTGLMLLTIIWVKGIKRSKLTILYFLMIFFLIGGAYFCWRWNYFGYPLPNPFYKKGGGRLYLDSLKVSIFNTASLCLPFLPAFILGLFYRKTIRKAIGFFIPIAGFAAAFILLSNEMNTIARFQYVLLPITLMAWWPLVEGFQEQLKTLRWDVSERQTQAAVFLVTSLFGLGAMNYLYNATHVTFFRDGKYDLALILAEYKDKGFTIATTEAGLLPLYSHWEALDVWGLNDKWIAHNGKLTEAYLKNFNPNIITYHSNFSPVAPPDPALRGDDWYEMVLTLQTYAEKNNYILAAVYGDSPNYVQYYFVRSDFPESAEIVRRIRTMEYYSDQSEATATNYAAP
jgi:arabinofuranosyltransferase